MVELWNPICENMGGENNNKPVAKHFIQKSVVIKPINIQAISACKTKHNNIHKPQNWNGSPNNPENGLNTIANSGMELE